MKRTFVKSTIIAPALVTEVTVKTKSIIPKSITIARVQFICYGKEKFVFCWMIAATIATTIIIETFIKTITIELATEAIVTKESMAIIVFITIVTAIREAIIKKVGDFEPVIAVATIIRAAVALEETIIVVARIIVTGRIIVAMQKSSFNVITVAIRAASTITIAHATVRVKVADSRFAEFNASTSELVLH